MTESGATFVPPLIHWAESVALRMLSERAIRCLAVPLYPKPSTPVEIVSRFMPWEHPCTNFTPMRIDVYNCKPFDAKLCACSLQET